MLSGLRTFSGIALLLGTGLLAGCASSANTPAEGQPTKAVKCEKCQTVWVAPQTSIGTHGQIVAIRSRKVMECPECRNEATRYIQTGKTLQIGDVVHKCQTCGSDMTACEVH